MRIRLTTQARADLRLIWDYIVVSSEGPQTANRVLRNLDKRIRLLADFPNHGVARSDLGVDARMLVFQRWVILYRVSANEILIIRVVDGARDISNLNLSDD